MTLLYKNDGLISGICNGFQALLKLGLLPWGNIIEEDRYSPALTFNESGKHQSSLVNTKIISNNSPWLSDFRVGDIFTIPVSHGEGRFVAKRSQIVDLERNGQIATAYVDNKGEVSGDFPYNPNGSYCGIEGILSPDGRIYGRMAHSERYIDDVYINCYGNKRMDIFSSGIKYFK